MCRTPLIILILALTAWTTAGCRTSSKATKRAPAVQMPGTELVRLPGPSSIRQDGSVRNRLIDKPNGHLLLTASANAVSQEQVDEWARNQVLQAAAANGLEVNAVEGWIQISEPRVIAVDDDTTQNIYDVNLEIWKLAVTPLRRQREVD